MSKVIKHLRIRCERFFSRVTFFLLVMMSITTQAAAQTKNTISVSGAPIISESILALEPVFAGKRNAVVMDQVCKLANDKQSFDEFNAFFSNKNISIAQLAIEDKGFASIAGNDISRMKTACAAYIATSVMIEPDEKDYMDQIVNKSDVAQGSKSTNKPVSKINPGKLTIALSKKMAAAQTNAFIFALIATQLEKRETGSEDLHSQSAQGLFAKYSPLYLKKFNELLGNTNIKFSLLQAKDDRFVFSSSTGYVFDFSKLNGLFLRLNGINWYGNGEFLGKKYMLNIDYLSE